MRPLIAAAALALLCGQARAQSSYPAPTFRSLTLGTGAATQLVFANPNVTGTAPQANGYAIEQDMTFNLPATATTGIWFGNELNFVVSGNPQGTQVWNNLDRGFFETANTATLDGVVRYIQAVRPGGFAAPNTVIQPLIVQAIDQTGLSSSQSGGMAALEVDLISNGLDNATLTNRGRDGIALVADNANPGGAPAEWSYGFGVFSGGARGFHQVFQLTAPFRDAGIDFRNAPAWTGSGTGTDNALWLRTGQKLALDTAGAAGVAAVTLSSVPGLTSEILRVSPSGIQFGDNQHAVIAPDAGSTIIASNLPWRLPAYAAASLPVLAAPNMGAAAYCSDCVRPDGGAGGTPIFLTASGIWVTALGTPPGTLPAPVVGVTPTLISAAGTVTLTATDCVVIINKTVGAATAVTLAVAPAAGQTVTIKDGKGDAATHAITITAAAGTIDGAANRVLNTAYGVVTLTYNGSQWNVVS